MNPTDPTLPMILGGMRTLTAALGGFAIAKGWITSDQATQLSGALVVLVTCGFSLWQKYEADKALKDAIAAPAGLAKPPAA